MKDLTLIKHLLSDVPQPLIFYTPVMLSLPSVDEACVIAVNVASNVKPKLTAQEEAMFIAGFQECVKYLSGQGKGNGA